MRVQIHEPIWNGGNGNEKVGISEDSLRDRNQLEVEITYADLYGVKPFPHIYTMSNERAATYHLRARIGKVPPLYMIPITDFSIKSETPPPTLGDGEVMINGEKYIIKKL
jgi:hypothetical protein